MEGKWHRKKGANSGVNKLNGGYGGPQPQLGYSEDKLRSRVYLQGPGSVRRVQRRMGFMSDSHAEENIKRCHHVNSRVDGDEFRKATAVYGHDLPNLMGKAVECQQTAIFDYWSGVDEGKYVLEIDVMQTGSVYTLIGVAVRNHEDMVSYTCAVGLGRKMSKRKLSGGDVKSATALLKATKQMVIHLQARMINVAKVISDEDTAISAIDEETWMNEVGVNILQLPTGVHAKRVENKQRLIKNKMRACTFCLPWAVPMSLIPHFVVAAVNWCNLDYCESNRNGDPPMKLVTGKEIDHRSWCIAHFGEFVMAPVTFKSVGKNKIDVQRRVGCVYMYPLGHGVHKLLIVDSINSNKLIFVQRRLRSGMVHPYMPNDVVGRLNVKAKSDRADFEAQGDREVELEFNEISGYVESEEMSLDEEFVIRSPVTLNYKPVEPDGEEIVEENVAVVTYEVTNDEDVEYYEYEYEKQRMNDLEAVLFGVDSDIHYCPPMIKPIAFAAKKEMMYHKAVHEFGRDNVNESMGLELLGIVKRKVWRPILKKMLTKTQRKRILPCIGLVKRKVKDGVDVLKSRLVGDGSKQSREGVDEYAEVSSPTGMISSLFALITNSAAKGWKNVTFDIGQAFLNAKLTGEKVYVKLDRVMARLLSQVDTDGEFSHMYEELLNEEDEDLKKGTIIVELDKALYGCIQSARAWYDTFSRALSTLGFMINERDPCVFNMAGDNGQIIASVFIHVDDGYLSCMNDDIVTKFKSQLEKIFTHGVTWTEGDFHEYLGMVMDFSTPGKCYVTMKDYIEKIVNDWSVDKVKEYPHTRELFTIDETKEKLNKEDAEQFHRCVAQLLYLATHVRPDILVSTIFLTSRVKEPTVEDRKKLLQCLAYLKGTSLLGLCLRADKDGKLRLNCYSDASFNVHPDAKSHAGIVIFLGGAATLFKSYKIKMVNKSVAESELSVLSDATSLLVHEREFAIAQQLIDASDNVIIHEDNTAAIHLVKNGRSTSDRTKHILLRHFFVKQYLDDGTFELHHCDTENMCADILTKPLQGEQFFKLRAILLGYSDIN